MGAFARPRWVPPARDCLAEVLSEVPEGVRKEPGGHEPRSAAAGAAGWTRCRPGRRGRTGKEEAKEPGQESAGARDPRRGGRGPRACDFKEPRACLRARGARGGPSSLAPSWDRLSGQNRLWRGRFFAKQRKETVLDFGSR